MIFIKLQSLWWEFDNLFMKDNEYVRVFFTKVSGIVNQIKRCGDTISDKEDCRENHVAAAIEESKDFSILSLHELIGPLEAHEKRIKRSTEKSIEQDFQSKVNWKEKEDKRKRRRSSPQITWKKQKFQLMNSNKVSNSSYNQHGSNDSNGKSVPQCHVCKKDGHKGANCWHKYIRYNTPNQS